MSDGQHGTDTGVDVDTSAEPTADSAATSADAADTKKIRSALLRYRVLAYTTGVWLLVLTAEMVAKYIFKVEDLPSWIAIGSTGPPMWSVWSPMRLTRPGAVARTRSTVTARPATPAAPRPPRRGPPG